MVRLFKHYVPHAVLLLGLADLCLLLLAAEGAWRLYAWQIGMGPADVGSHTVCAIVTDAFLDFSKSRGNDLSTPLPEYGFPGLKDGDRWCLCAPRWQEAFEAGRAPRVILRATHEGALAHCGLAELKAHAADLS